MQQPSTQSAVLDAWHTVCRYIAAGNAHEFLGRKKETLVFHRIRREIEASDPSRLLSLTGPDMQARFRNWNIDLVCVRTGKRLAIEGKYKLQRDGAVPDNRKAAFFDLFKLEQ